MLCFLSVLARLDRWSSLEGERIPNPGGDRHRAHRGRAISAHCGGMAGTLVPFPSDRHPHSMVRLYQYLVVEPTATVPGRLRSTGEVARDSSIPIVFYPDGTHTRDVRLGSWREGGAPSHPGSVSMDGLPDCSGRFMADGPAHGLCEERYRP